MSEWPLGPLQWVDGGWGSFSWPVTGESWWGQESLKQSLKYVMLQKHTVPCAALCTPCYLRPSYLCSCCCFGFCGLSFFSFRNSLFHPTTTPFTWLTLTHFSGPSLSLKGRIFKEAFLDLWLRFLSSLLSHHLLLILRWEEYVSGSSRW